GGQVNGGSLEEGEEEDGVDLLASHHHEHGEMELNDSDRTLAKEGMGLSQLSLSVPCVEAKNKESMQSVVQNLCCEEVQEEAGGSRGEKVYKGGS
ncbi:hypothetical protein A2U01_0075887, partial [Trifolium medium]|nr:hypothetical protein [Trifolium medium]